MKTKRKLFQQMIGILLCLAMVLSYMPVAALAAEGPCADGGCTGSYTDGFCSLCGGYEAPELVGSRYEISNAGQLYWFADRVNNGDLTINGVLVKDITVNEKVLDAKGNPVNTASLRTWTPIGRGIDRNFCGDFDGNGYVIRGLYCAMPEEEATDSGAGLFGTAHSSHIEEILIEDSYFEGQSTGAFAGYAYDCNIINCHSSATVKGYTNVGGIVANAIATTISKSGSTGRTIYSGKVFGTLGGVLGKGMLVQGDDFVQVMGCYYNGALEIENTIYLEDKGALVGGVKYVRVSDCYYLDTLGEAIGSTVNIYDDSEYFLDESTVLSKTRAEFANGTVCDLMGFHPAIDNPWFAADEACLLCPATRNAHIPVEQIDGEVLLNITPGKYTLPGGVLPTNASCKEILWTVLSGPATVNGTVLEATATGTIELQATVKNGGAERRDFTQIYTIQCTQGQSFDMSNGSVVIEKYNDTQWKITYGWVVTGTETFIQNADQPVWITGETQQHSITVKSGATPTICLRDCNLLAQDNKAGLAIEPGAKVTLQLNGANTLASSNSAGIAVPEGAELVITGNGSLVARTEYSGNAAIGGTVENVNWGTITIYSGTVTAEASRFGAPIGGGKDAEGGTGGNITIYGGTVTAITGGYSAGIGGGQKGGAGKIAIHGGTVTVRNTDAHYEGACIGTGWAGTGGSVEITGGTVVASNAGSVTGPGIGGTDVAVTISGGTISAEVSSNYGDTALQGTVVITGGNVKAATATEPTDGKGNQLSLHILTVMGASENSVIEALDGVAYGLKDVKLLDHNKLYFYLPEGTNIQTVTFDGKTVPDAEGDLMFCDHSFVWTTLVESTCIDKGIEVYQCEICGYHKEIYETILAPGPYPESEHPLKSNLDDTQRYFLSGAKSMTVTFSNDTKLFHNFDYIYIYDANGKQIGRTYTGDELAGKTIEITGNAFSVRVTSNDVGINYYGYSIDSVYAIAPADAEHIDRLPLAEHTYEDGACTVCGVAEHTHNWTYTSNGNDTHKKVCTICSRVEIEAEAHSTQAEGDRVATCKAPGYCSVCQSEYGEADMTNHDSSVDYVGGFCPNCDAYEPAVPNGEVYEISNAGQLYWFAAEVNSGRADINGKLMNDIVINENLMEKLSIALDGTATVRDGETPRLWTPIGYTKSMEYGSEDHSYKGTFDGNQKSIYGLYCTGWEIPNVSGDGVFGSLLGTVSNLSLKDSYITGNYDAGSIVCFVGSTGKVYNCYNGATVYSGRAGGIASSITGTVEKCYNTGEVFGCYTVGGVVGSNHGGIVKDCRNYGPVIGQSTSYGVLGGVVGSMGAYGENSRIENCYNSGDVYNADVVGGVLGEQHSGIVTNCYNNGTLEQGTYLGGVAGKQYGGTISNCYNGVSGKLVGSTVDEADIGNSYYLWETETEDGGKTAEQFYSGQIAWLLSKGCALSVATQQRDEENNRIYEDRFFSGEVWGQNLDNEEETQYFPNFEGGKVYYGYISCAEDAQMVYTNTPASDTKGHSWTAATCTTPKTCDRCGATEGEALGHTDKDGNNYCDTCMERLSPAILHGKSLSLQGDISINFYMDLAEEVLADKNAYMEFRKEGGNVIHASLAEASNTEGYYVFTIPMTSKEMADVVEAQFFWSEGSTEVYTYSVKTYVDNKLPICEDEALKNLLTAMLHYGAAAQIYFGYHTDRLANEGLEAPDYSAVNIEGFEVSKGQATELLCYYGSSLQLNSRTAIRFVFHADPTLQEITASCNGETLEWTREGDYISVIVDDISAKDLDEFVTLTVSDGADTIEVSYSPMTYCQNVRKGNKPVHTPELKTLMDALYVYNQAANVYFGDK